MRPNLINRLKKAMKRLTRDDTEHGVEYYRADEVDALLAEQPAQVDGDTIVQTFTGLPRRKLRDLLSGGWEVNGVCFQRIETDGTVRRGAATTGGMVLWWNAEQPAQQEPVAVPTTPYEHRKFVLVGREWYERFAAFHDDCQIGERLTREEQTVRQQGYENGWNDAQRYLKEPQSTSPTPAQQEPGVAVFELQESGWEIICDGDWIQTLPLRTKLYTSPPAQRTWVGLTDKEEVELWESTDSDWELMKRTEAKLKEKNT